MAKENFYTLREMGDQLARQNAVELARDLNAVGRDRPKSYAMHTPDNEAGVLVGCPEDARCKYFGF